ncbi:MAG: DivIVA domain-containing protein [Clostridiales bacterium]|nr:DivIVA domain-containing protein [bacterium 210917-SL.2.15]MCI5843194.1 DivIVA domain-containing protein [Clostridiales bacterium]MDY4037476.1 DivIVA domain-containing protein [Candidatus Pseudoscilispira sp.]
MLTPQEVSTHVFSKARMGGYNMAMVDEFLDTLTEDYTTLYKENAALKAKLKVLVDKVEEYRATEDSMRATLLTAQKMASQMVQEAEKEKADLLAAAESEMGARKAALEAEIAAESERLRLAKEESAAFIANMRRLCSSELEFLDGVPEIQVNAPSAQAAQETSVDEQVHSIESSVLSSFAEPETPAEAEAEAEAVPEEGAPAEEAAPVEAEGARQDASEDLEATRRIDFGDLKFGRNYKSNS